MIRRLPLDTPNEFESSYIEIDDNKFAVVLLEILTREGQDERNMQSILSEALTRSYLGPVPLGEAIEIRLFNWAQLEAVCPRHGNRVKLRKDNTCPMCLPFNSRG